MRIHVILFTLVLSFISFSVVAGANHDHGHSHEPVSQKQLEEAAIKNVERLVDKGKLDKSWESTGITKSEQKMFDTHMEWVVTFKNDQVSDSSKQILYMFLTLGGEYIAANYTGK